MKRLVFSIFLIVFGSTAHAYEYWNNIRHSSLLPDNTVNIRLENPTGVGTENFLLYASGGIQENAMAQILDGPSTLSATVPGPVAAMRYYGFRLIQVDALDLMPVRIANGVLPEPADLTRLAADAAGDALFGYVNLDLVDCRVSFSNDRFYAALQNAGGGFPVNQGLTFFGYLLGIADPAQADPDTVWGLMHTYQQAGVISPGLYRITGTGFGDLTKIGEIQMQARHSAGPELRQLFMKSREIRTHQGGRQPQVHPRSPMGDGSALRFKYSPVPPWTPRAAGLRRVPTER